MVEQTDQAIETPERGRTINERAYAIWHEEGQPAGKDQEHWLRAEQEFDDYSGSASAPNPASEPGKTTA